MKLAHYVFLAIIATAFLLPKLLIWLSGVMLCVAFVMLLLWGPVTVANWFLPRPPKS
ncbi:hypothetical protein D9M69_402430 [compost metagenome]